MYIWYMLLLPGRRSAQHIGSDFSKSYTMSNIFLTVVWLVYPVIVSSHALSSLFRLADALIRSGVSQMVVT
jgi:bacteriorhodopsin